MRLAICFFLMCGPAWNLSAAIIFELGSVTAAAAGGQVAIPVYVTGTAGEPLEAFDLPIDIGGDGRGFPDGVSFAGTGIAGDGFAQAVDSFGEIVISGTDPLPPVPPFDPRFDAVFSDDGATIWLSAVPRHLFNILVQLPADWSGPIPVEFTTSGFPTPLSVTSGTTNLTEPTTGVLELRNGRISLIPEPGAAGLLGWVTVAVAAGLRNPRRRRRAAIS